MHWCNFVLTSRRRSRVERLEELADGGVLQQLLDSLRESEREWKQREVEKDKEYRGVLERDEREKVPNRRRRRRARCVDRPATTEVDGFDRGGIGARRIESANDVRRRNGGPVAA